MKLINLTNFMNSYLLSLFNTGQVTLPKAWRDKFNTKKFLAKETREGLLIKPLVDEDGVVFYEHKDGFGIYSEAGIDPDKIIKTIQKMDKPSKKKK